MKCMDDSECSKILPTRLIPYHALVRQHFSKIVSTTCHLRISMQVMARPKKKNTDDKAANPLRRLTRSMRMKLSDLPAVPLDKILDGLWTSRCCSALANLRKVGLIFTYREKLSMRYINNIYAYVQEITGANENYEMICGN